MWDTLGIYFKHPFLINPVPVHASSPSMEISSFQPGGRLSLGGVARGWSRQAAVYTGAVWPAWDFTVLFNTWWPGQAWAQSALPAEGPELKGYLQEAELGKYMPMNAMVGMTNGGDGKIGKRYTLYSVPKVA